MIAVIDYGVGNLFSLASSLKYLGLDNVVTREIQEVEQADRIILPGVGAFADAADKLHSLGLDRVVCEQAERGKPLLGICLGMQMLFEKSYEFGEYEGLGLIPGDICPLADDLSAPLKVPHIGWNSLHLRVPGDSLLKYTQEGDYVYYVHSYYAKHCEESIIATSSYGVDITGVVRRGNVCGTQFHPEKSGEVGLRILRAFAEL